MECLRQALTGMQGSLFPCVASPLSFPGELEGTFREGLEMLQLFLLLPVIEVSATPISRSRHLLTAMVMTQKIHLHPFASARNPPAIGPIMGPRIGPTDHMDIASPLLSRGIKSAIVPLPMVIGATPANPARKRKTVNMAMLTDTALRIVNMTKRMLHVW